ncbi:unnamed protein product [Caenorhabditis angaria]|uniref:Uncharacterized protein n=1 Tax=Caenorhabditis angaria TaxID=860376 RepID=A0A9P1I4B9_9PELO|nr:unnamed protein product [Caenorhabditis angaria]
MSCYFNHSCFSSTIIYATLSFFYTSSIYCLGAYMRRSSPSFFFFSLILSSHLTASGHSFHQASSILLL